MRILTKTEFTQVAGKQYAPDSYFNPVLDADGDRVISEEEVQQSADEFAWLKDLPEKEHKPIVIQAL